MLRERLREALTSAMKSGDKGGVSTIRLTMAALKDRDIAERSKDNADGLDDGQILAMLQAMVKQRRESIALYEKGARLELAEQERAEIEVIERFLPKQMTDDEIASAVAAVVEATGASTLKDMGGVMAALRERHAGQMDFGKAGALVKQRLG